MALSQDEIMQIKQLIAQDNVSNRFRLSPSNRHIHNNVDAPFVYLPYSIFGGLVLIDGTINPPAANATPGFLPAGWVSVKNATGDYIVTHNLGTTMYSVVFSSLANTALGFVAAIDENKFQVDFFDTATQTLTDSPFGFILVQFDNNSATFPKYTKGSVIN